MSTVDRASLRNHRRKGSRKGRGLRRMSVDDLSSSEEDHLARVSDLKSFFENLNKSDATGKERFHYATPHAISTSPAQSPHFMYLSSMQQ